MSKKMISLALVFLAGLFSLNTLAEDVPTRAFYANASILNMKIAPDGKHVGFTFEEGTEVRLAIMNLATQRITTTFGLGERQHVFDFWWSSDRRVVMAVGEVTGYLDNTGRASRYYAGDINGRRREQLHDGTNYSMQILHALLGPGDDADALLEAALHVAGKRVVVKRPRLAATLAGRKPSHQLTGRSSRFDVYAS